MEKAKIMENADKLIGKLVEYLQSAEAFVTANAPDFVNQFVAYQTWQAYLWFYVWIGITLLFVAWQLINVIYFTIADVEIDTRIFNILMAGIGGTVALLLMLGSFTEVKKLELAPKVFMLEKARDMLKSGSCGK